MDCIFCKIVAGEFDSAKVFENDNVFAFLDINPYTKGHCLVVPKQHFESIFDIDEDQLKNVISAAKRISEKIKINLEADGISLLQSNGKQAGQEVLHFHLHIIPRYRGDGIIGNWGHIYPKKAEIKELNKIADKIKDLN